jgi:hypothetical protein
MKTKTPASGQKVAAFETMAAQRTRILAEIYRDIPGGRPASFDEIDNAPPKTRRGATAVRRQAPVWLSHKEPGVTANPKSAAFKDGYESQQGGCWWRGCPHCHETQEFADWQAGWHKAYNESLT